MDEAGKDATVAREADGRRGDCGKVDGANGIEEGRLAGMQEADSVACDEATSTRPGE